MPSELPPGDEAAFVQFWDKTHRKVYRVARAFTADHERAQDMMSEAFVMAYVHWDEVVASPSPEGWVLKTVHNCCVDEWRKWTRRWAANVPVEDFVPPSHFDSSTDPRFAEAFGELTLRQREVLVLRYVADMSRGEIAEMLGLGVSSVATHLERGLGKLRAQLGQTSPGTVVE